MPRKIAFDRISFLPDTENTGSSVFSRKMRPMHRVLFVFQTRDCHWNASVNTRFCQFSLLLFGIQSNHRISIREHSYPSAYKHTKLELRILFLALLFFALSQLYSQNFFFKKPSQLFLTFGLCTRLMEPRFSGKFSWGGLHFAVAAKNY